MNYKKIESEGYNIHIIHNKGFHTIDFSVFFTENVDCKKITYRNALIDMLTYSTKCYDTNTKLIRRCQELYSIRPTASITRFGNLLSTKFNISIIQSKYVPNANIKDNIMLLKEIILNPLLIDNKFKKDILDVMKKGLEVEIRSLEEDPRALANLSLLDKMGKENYTLTTYCNLEVLNEINENNLYNSYIDMLENSKIDIFICGNISNDEEIINLIQDHFHFKASNRNLVNALINHENKKEEPCFFKHNKPYQQSKLAIGCKLYNLTSFENKYVLPVFNTILGGNADSLLMKYVREEHGLCYYVGSYFNKLDNLLVITSGINKENYKKTINLINDTIKGIINGNFTTLDIKKAKVELLVGVDNLKENNRNLIDYRYGMEVFSSDDLEKKKELINQVSKEDIKKVASKLNIDTIFFLEGEL